MPAHPGAPRTVIFSAPRLWQATVSPSLCQRLLDTHRQVWFFLLWGLAPFSWVLVHMKFCLSPPRVCFPSPVEVLQSKSMAFKVKFRGGYQSVCHILRSGNLLWTLELLQHYESFFCRINCSPVCGSSAQWLYGGADGDLSQEDLCHTPWLPGLCSQSPCPHGRPLLTCASRGDTQTLKGRSRSVFCGVSGSWCTQGFV